MCHPCAVNCSWLKKESIQAIEEVIPFLSQSFFLEGEVASIKIWEFPTDNGLSQSLRLAALPAFVEKTDCPLHLLMKAVIICNLLSTRG